MRADRLVLQLAQRLRDAQIDDTAEKLERAWSRETRVLGLNVADREVPLRVLGDGPAELAELRGVLLNEHEWRRAEGLGRRDPQMPSPPGSGGGACFPLPTDTGHASPDQSQV